MDNGVESKLDISSSHNGSDNISDNVLVLILSLSLYFYMNGFVKYPELNQGHGKTMPSTFMNNSADQLRHCAHA